MTTTGRAAALCACVSLAACGGAAKSPDQTLTVDVRVDGGGSARVVSSPPGIDCASGTCSAQFRRGTAVTLRSDLSPARFVRWVGVASAGTAQEWTVSLDQDEAVTGVFASANYVFVTSSALDPASLTLASADAECAARAHLAGLPGTYRAWLSSASEGAASRLGAARGWVRTDGLPFVDSLGDLLAGHIDYPPRLDEFAQPARTFGVRTLTTPAGMFSGTSCPAGGTEIVGSPSGGPGTWTYGGATSECAALSVYCFGVDVTAAVTMAPATGRVAFVSTATFTPGSGVEGADAACALEASASGLPGSYRALLATSTAAPTARFNLAGEPWVRPDGVAIVRSASDLATASELLAPIAVAADGAYRAGGWTGLAAWSGVHNANLSVPGTLDTTCDDWTLTAGGTFPTTGDVAETNARYYAMGWSDCAAPLHLYCLQQ